MRFRRVIFWLGAIIVLLSAGVHIVFRGITQANQVKAEIPGEVNEFIKALRSGNVALVRNYLASHKNSINLPIINRLTPLEQAVDANQLSMAKFLISQGADVNHADSKGVTPLHRAAYMDFADMVTLLIDSGAKTEALRESGNTPLLYAAERGNVEAADALLKGGANVDSLDEKYPTRDNGGRVPASPLYMAIINKKKDVTKLLLAHGANVNVVDHWYHTALDYAAQNAGWSDIVKTILDRSVECDAVRNGVVASMICVGDPESLDLISQCIKTKTGKAPNLTPSLNCAVRNSNTNMIKALVSRGASTAQVTPLGGTAKNSSGRYSEEMTSYLLENGVSANAKDKYGWTALHGIAWQPELGNIKIAKILLSHGADINSLGPRGITPLDRAAEAGQPDMASFLIQNGADVNATTANGETPLSLAILNNKLDMAKVLIAHGAKVDPRGISCSKTPLGIAVLKEDAAFAKLLIDNGADINGVGNKDITPLGAAASLANNDIALLLLNNGADVNAQDIKGATPLHWAARADDATLVRKLVEKGARLSIKDQLGLVPLRWATSNQVRTLLSTKKLLGKQELTSLCQEIASIANHGKLDTLGKERLSSFTPVRNPWDREENDIIPTPNRWTRVRLHGTSYLLGQLDDTLLTLTEDANDHYFQPLCVFERKVGLYFALDDVEQVLKAASAQRKDPYDYALEHVGTAMLSALLDAHAGKYSSLHEKNYLMAVLYHAIELKRNDAVRVLLDHGVDPNPNMEDLKAGVDGPNPSDLARALEKRNVQWPFNKYNLVYGAIQSGNVDIMRLVLDHGVNPNTPGVDGVGYPVFDLNSQANSNSYPLSKMVELLLKHGADPTYVTYSSFEGLLKKHDNQTIKLLFEYGASPKYFNGVGNVDFALMAEQFGNLEAARIVRNTKKIR